MKLTSPLDTLGQDDAIAQLLETERPGYLGSSSFDFNREREASGLRDRLSNLLAPTVSKSSSSVNSNVAVDQLIDDLLAQARAANVTKN